MELHTRSTVYLLVLLFHDPCRKTSFVPGFYSQFSALKSLTVPRTQFPIFMNQGLAFLLAEGGLSAPELSFHHTNPQDALGEGPGLWD